MDTDTIDFYAIIGLDQDVLNATDHAGLDQIATVRANFDGYIRGLDLHLPAIDDVIGIQSRIRTECCFAVFRKRLNCSLRNATTFQNIGQLGDC